MNKLRLTHTAIAAAVAALALGACSRQNDERTAGQKIDSAIAQTEQRAEEAKAEVKEGMDKARESAGAATDKVATGVEDATITASVNAELAKDPKLSALRINVDTANGRVILRGSAPDGVSRERATHLAQAVKGVVSVDNQLEVRG
jgi:osmotically-inducible protein OsmY